MVAWDNRKTWRHREQAERYDALDPAAVQTSKLYGHSNAELRDLIDTEREAGRAWGQVAEAARILLALRTGRGA